MNSRHIRDYQWMDTVCHLDRVAEKGVPVYQSSGKRSSLSLTIGTCCALRDAFLNPVRLAIFKKNSQTQIWDFWMSVDSATDAGFLTDVLDAENGTVLAAISTNDLTFSLEGLQ